MEIFMIQQKERIKKLEEENEELRATLALALNKPLLKQIAEGIERIKKGEYYTEEEFFKRHQLSAA